LRSDLLELLGAEPGGEAILENAYEGVHLVGGSVRDLMLGRAPRELDVVVEGEIEPLLRALGGELTVHDRFETASVRLGEARVDVARARRERYPRPGALPEVEPARLADDLLRRDFTVNAIAVSLAGAGRGAVQEAAGALDDLDAGRMRVLHDRSFIDDPTRLWRLCRYAVRLGFAPEEQTADLAGAAIEAGAMETVTAARVGAELRLVLEEEDPLAALGALQRLGALRVLQVGAVPGEGAARAALALLPEDGRSDLLLLAALLGGAVTAEDAATADSAPRARAQLLDRLEYPAAERDRVVATLAAVPLLVEALPGDPRPSELYALAARTPPEAVALAAGLATEQERGGDEGRGERARRAAQLWLGKLRHVRLRINGDDLIAAGVAQGPEVGRRLEAALRLRLDGEIADGADAELRAALEAV
jgi:tRNA nucleotidyltransferase (CCA-adding enzyme)